MPSARASTARSRNFRTGWENRLWIACESIFEGGSYHRGAKRNLDRSDPLDRGGTVEIRRFVVGPTGSAAGCPSRLRKRAGSAECLEGLAGKGARKQRKRAKVCPRVGPEEHVEPKHGEYAQGSHSRFEATGTGGTEATFQGYEAVPQDLASGPVVPGGFGGPPEVTAGGWGHRVSPGIGSFAHGGPVVLETGGRPRRFSLATVVVSVTLSLIVGGLAGGAGGALLAKGEPTPVRLPEPAPVALPEGASIADLVHAVEPGVAAIHVTAGLQAGAGTGFLVDGRGHIITNRHVIEGAREIRVNLAGKKNLKADVVGVDPEIDIAVIRIQPFDGMRPLSLGNSETLRVGDTVVAIGNALDLPGGPTVTMGIVSALDRSLSDATPSGQRIILTGLIQTDAAINPGNSGGPLLNLAGQVVGVNTAVAANPRDITGSQQAQNIGFAININDAKSSAENIINGVVSKRGIIGVDVATVNSAVAARRGLSVDEGALVVDVLEGGPAEKAGIRRDDVIVAVDGKQISTAEQLRAVLRTKKPGDTVRVEVARGTERLGFDVTLAEMP